VKLYTFPAAPNPRRLNLYLAEKGLRVPAELVSIPQGETRAPAFLAKNPLGGLPVLELDDGTLLTESLAIIEYLEELHPEPPMIGTTPLERARVRALERVCELGVLARVGRVVHHTRSPIPGFVSVPAVAEQARAELFQKELPGPLAFLDLALEGRPFVAGDAPTIADCTLFAALEFGRFFGVDPLPAFANLTRWHTAFLARPSAWHDPTAP
jgi:glutathione S-transferase